MIEVYYEYNGQDYKIASFNETEGVSWKNTAGTPINFIRNLLRSEAGYIDPIPGKYTLHFYESSVEIYNDQIETCYTSYDNHSALQQACFETIRTNYPVVADITDDNGFENEFLAVEIVS